MLSYRVLLQETVVTKEEKDLSAVSCSVTVVTLGILFNLFFNLFFFILSCLYCRMAVIAAISANHKNALSCRNVYVCSLSFSGAYYVSAQLSSLDGAICQWGLMCWFHSTGCGSSI